MGRIKQYRTALARYKHSKGFGIHSPFAFYFVRAVLRERCPYYSYLMLEQLRALVIDRLRLHVRHPKVISLSTAKMLFRVTNYFNPQQILQVGTSYGVSSAGMLAVSSSSQLILCEPKLGEYPVTHSVLAIFGKRISFLADLTKAIDIYRASLGQQLPFILVNSLTDAEQRDAILPYIDSVIAGKSVVILRNLGRSPLMKQLWEECKTMPKHGMTFSNEKIAIVIADPKLPRQDFTIWF